LVSQLREDLLPCSSYLPLGVPDGLLFTSHQALFLAPLLGIEEEEAPTSTTHRTFSGAIAGEEEDFCKESLSRKIIYFVFVLLYFIFACIFLSKIQKN
jgi:hypothetical protein